MARKLYTISIFCCTRLNENGAAGWQAEPACTSALTGRDFNRSPVHYKKRTASHRIFRAAGWQAEPACTSALTGRDFNRSPVHYKKRTASHRTLCARRARHKCGLAGWQAEPAPSSALTGGTILTQATANTKRINAHRSLRARRIGGARHESGLARPPDGLHLHAGRAIIREKAVSAPVHK